MLKAIYPIVEGHGEVSSVPLLLRRFAHEVFQNYEVTVFPAHRVPRGQMLSPHGGQLEKAVELGARKIAGIGGPGIVLVMLDADDDCPAQIGPTLLARIRAVRQGLFCSAIVAKSEYEGWLLAATHSLRGARDVKANADAPADPENIRAAKEYLERNLLNANCCYTPRVDQPRLTAHMEFDQAGSCLSFQKLRRDLQAAFAL